MAVQLHGDGHPIVKFDPVYENLSCCQFEADPDSDDENTDETSWHYLRRCTNCTYRWYSLHCKHDGVQTPCPACSYVHEPEKY